MRHLTIILALSAHLTLTAFGQTDTTIITGTYQGKHIYVQDQYLCITYMTVGDDWFIDYTKYRAAHYEVNFDFHGREIGDTVKITIVTRNDCNVRILNPEVIGLSDNQTFDFSDKSFNIGAIYRTYDITFDPDKTTIIADSHKILKRIADFLKENKGLAIEIGVHTDTRVSEEYSEKITEDRAESIRMYLNEQGVDPEQLLVNGFEDLRPLIPDKEIRELKTTKKQEEAHQKNRRVELKILWTD